MLQTLWAEVRNGRIEPLESVALPEGAKLIVTLLSREEDDNGFWLSTSEFSLKDIWENAEDDVYADLLQG